MGELAAAAVNVRTPAHVPTSPALTRMPELRAALGRRVDDCWDRLEDAVSELVAVHEVPESLIVMRIQRTIEAELLTPPR